MRCAATAASKTVAAISSYRDVGPKEFALTNPATLRASWLRDYAQPFTGWDMSYLAGRRITIRPHPSWNYTAAVLAAIDDARSHLDMDTGGGEFLAGLPRRSPETYATEGYRPNVPVARQALEPLGVVVTEVEDVTSLPFEDGQFDLVTNRHGKYLPVELYRVLAPGGLFMTQQVASQTNQRLHELLGHQPSRDAWNLATAVPALEAAGFHVGEQREETLVTRYFDVGSIVYYLKAVPWEIPDFSIESYFDELLQIQELIDADGFLDVPFHQFFVRAHRDAGEVPGHGLAVGSRCPG
jgi:SAM-dependent methyltransferase